jgi:hypothetical protein
VASVLAGDSSGAHDYPGAHGYQSYPLTGSPARRLQDDTARQLGRGTVPRCPHPGEPAFWFLSTGLLACVPCTSRLLDAGAGADRACQVCGNPANTAAAWVVGDVPCIAALCEICHGTGLVPLIPN